MQTAPHPGDRRESPIENNTWKISIAAWLLVALAMFAACVAAPANAQTTPTQCHCWPGGPGCVCDTGTVPPISALACDPAADDIDGCDKAFMPQVAR